MTTEIDLMTKERALEVMRAIPEGRKTLNEEERLACFSFGALYAMKGLTSEDIQEFRSICRRLNTE